MHITRLEIGPRMSQGVVAGGMLYVSGQVAQVKSVGIEDQTRQVLARIEAILSAAEADKSGLVAITVYLADITDFAAMNRIYDAWIDPANPPARACVEAKMANPAIRVEMTAVCMVRG